MLDSEQEKLWQLIVMRGEKISTQYMSYQQQLFELYKVDYDRYMLVRNAETNLIVEIRKL